MRQTILPVMSVLTVVAIAAGLQLGDTTVGQIDPLYFQGAAPTAHDVTKYPRPARHNAYAQASGWAEGYQARAADCGNCPALLVRHTSAPIPSEPLYAYSDPTIEPRWQQAAAEMPAEESKPERSAEAARVQRYLDYPVSADQAEIRAALKGAEATAELPAEPDGL